MKHSTATYYQAKNFPQMPGLKSATCKRVITITAITVYLQRSTKSIVFTKRSMCKT